jgi:hypothetical protein
MLIAATPPPLLFAIAALFASMLRLPPPSLPPPYLIVFLFFDFRHFFGMLMPPDVFPFFRHATLFRHADYFAAASCRQSADATPPPPRHCHAAAPFSPFHYFAAMIRRRHCRC